MVVAPRSSRVSATASRAESGSGRFACRGWRRGMRRRRRFRRRPRQLPDPGPRTPAFGCRGTRSSGALAGLTLAFGVFVGLALGAAFPGAGFATGRFVVQVPAASQQAAASESGGTAPAAPLGRPVGNVGGGGSAPGPAPAGIPAAAPSRLPPAGLPRDSGPSKGNNPGPGHHALPPAHTKPSVEGTVVHVNPVAQSYTVATTEGQLVAIHTADLPKPATKVSLNVRQLFNGTFAERGKRTGSAKPAKRHSPIEANVAGAVTYRDPIVGVYAVSVNGASVLVHMPAGFSPDDVPQLNYDVSAAVMIEVPKASKRDTLITPTETVDARREPAPTSRSAVPPRPRTGAPIRSSTAPRHRRFSKQQSVSVEGQPVGAIHLEGIVERACADSGGLQDLGR